jgi:transcriptional regulator
MMASPVDLLQGTLDMLILKAVSLGRLHGYGILLRIQQISRDQLVIQQGSLYPALYRLEHNGMLLSEWGESDNNRRAKYYTLSVAGKRQLESETDKWSRMSKLVSSMLRVTSVPRRAYEAAPRPPEIVCPLPASPQAA